MKEDYKNILYSKHPHFAIGKVDQWSESGYLFYKGKVYHYFEDRNGNCGEVTNPMDVERFISYAKQKSITIPQKFMEVLGR